MACKICKQFRVLFKKVTFRKSCYSWERTVDGIDINDTANLEDSPRFVFIDEECKNLIVVNDGGEVTRNFN